MTPMLELKNLQVNYGVVPALKGISISVNQGEIVALIGPNGAGKTTTLHAISNIVKSNTGSIFLRGNDISAKPAHQIVKLGISQVPEGRGIFPDLTVEENLMLGTYLRKDKEQIKEDKEWVYGIFPRLRERRSQYGGTLSGGEQQMLAIARALMAKPEVLLLDEPSMGLAPVIVEEIFRTIKRINRDFGTTILLVEQNAQMALAVANRAYVIEVGEVIMEGTAGELKNNNEIQKSYLGI